MRPRDFVSIEFFVEVTTEYGVIKRRIIAFDPEDALSQLLAYCDAEGLTTLSSSVK